MIWTDRIKADNQDYQRELAISLIGCMGVERALRACQANGDKLLTVPKWYTFTPPRGRFLLRR